MSHKWRTFTAIVSVLAYAIAVIAVSVHHPEHHSEADFSTAGAVASCSHHADDECSTSKADSTRSEHKHPSAPSDHSHDECSICKFAAQPVNAAAASLAIFHVPFVVPAALAESRKMAQATLFSGSPRGPPSIG